MGTYPRFHVHFVQPTSVRRWSTLTIHSEACNLLRVAGPRARVDVHRLVFAVHYRHNEQTEKSYRENEASSVILYLQRKTG